MQAHGGSSLVKPANSSASGNADRWLTLISVFAIATSLIGLAATLAGIFHAPQVLLIGTIIAGISGYATRNHSSNLPGAKPRWSHLLLLLLVALIFRVPPYNYVTGGQDEGVYVNIGNYIDKTGGIDIHDEVQQKLQDTSYLERYLSDNTIGSNYLLGVYKLVGQDHKVGKLQFQFYDLFPVWIAVFCGLFGQTSGVWSLTFLSLLSIVLFYRIALMITGSYRAALAAGGLLALNPLHAFFSKFPVTEVPTLCFALIGFVMLLAYWSAPAIQRRNWWLSLSVFAFSCVFATRISGFMYIPFFVALGWSAVIFDGDPIRSRMLNCWAVGTVAAYSCSVGYGIIWSFPYSSDIYRESFEPILGHQWRALLLCIIVAVLLAWLGIALLRWRRGWEQPLLVSRRFAPVIAQSSTFVIAAALSLGLLKIWRFGWTKRYMLDNWLSGQWHLANAGWLSASASSFWTLTVFVGPFVVCAFLFGSVRRRHDPIVIFLHWFAAGFFAYIMLLQWVIPYSPYYARYLLSELVPYSVLFVTCVWCTFETGIVRRIFSASILLSLLYAVSVSAAQIGKNENEGAYTSLSKLVAPTDASDVILLDSSSFNQSEVKTPLLYTFHRNVITVDEVALNDADYLDKLGSLYGRVFFLTTQSHAPDGFVPVESSNYRVMQYDWNHSYPHKLVVRRDVQATLYRRQYARVPLGGRLSFAQHGVGAKWLRSGWSHPESWGTWSLGRKSVIAIDQRDFPQTDEPLSLVFDATVLVSPKHPVQQIIVFADELQVGEYIVRYPETHVSLAVPMGMVQRGERVVSVSFMLPDAATPKELGINDDIRSLAIGLISARFSVRSNMEGK